MNKINLLICLLIISTLGYTQSSIYNIQVKGISGNNIDFASFRGKRILIINIASASNRVSQYADLKKLYQYFKDKSLVILCFPSNDFNTENKTESELQTFFNGTNNQFVLGKKLSVKGNNISPLYQWLTQKSKNGFIDIEVKGDYQKFLINSEGKLIAVFSGRESPLNNMLGKALRE